MAPILGIYASQISSHLSLTVDYLVVAGGGGGSGFFGGGAGAGGLRSTVTATGGGGTLETAFIPTPSTSYTITIGSRLRLGVDFRVPSTPSARAPSWGRQGGQGEGGGGRPKGEEKRWGRQKRGGRRRSSCLHWRWKTFLRAVNLHTFKICLAIKICFLHIANFVFKFHA